MLARAGRTAVRMRLTLTPRNLGRRESSASRRRSAGHRSGCGRDRHRCHLDSWDLGTGAFDQRGGKSRSPPPPRTGSCRLGRRAGRSEFLFGAEEVRRIRRQRRFERHRNDGNVVLVGDPISRGQGLARRLILPPATQPWATGDGLARAARIVRGREPANGRPTWALGAGRHGGDRLNQGWHPLFRITTPATTRSTRSIRHSSAERRGVDGVVGGGANWPGTISRTDHVRALKPFHGWGETGSNLRPLLPKQMRTRLRYSRHSVRLVGPAGFEPNNLAVMSGWLYVELQARRQMAGGGRASSSAARFAPPDRSLGRHGGGQIEDEGGTAPPPCAAHRLGEIADRRSAKTEPNAGAPGQSPSGL